MKKNNCPLCDKKNTKFSFKAAQTIYYQCQNCKLVFAKDLPRTNYVDYNLDHFIKWENYLKNVLMKQAKGLKKYKTSGNVLEIGIGMGYMMEIMQGLGFKVLGVEPSEKLVKEGKKKGFKIKKGYFEDLKLPDESFDIIILSHVLEHIQNPNKFIKQIKRVLKKDGILLIQVPNFGSYEARLLKTRWPYLVPNDHFLQFTHQTLQQLLKNHNLRVIEADSTSSLSELDNILKELRRCINSDWKRLIYYLIMMIPSSIQDLFNQGSALRYIVTLK